MEIRKTQPQDSIFIAEIYNHYIKNSVITFEENAVDVNEIALRIEKISSKYPYLVLVENTEVLGYAYACEWRNRSAYRFSAEITIYLHHKIKSKGFGTKLLCALIDEMKKTDIKVLIGGIALPNPASIALHEKLGFKKVAHFEKIGFKFDNWIDVGYWELKL